MTPATMPQNSYLSSLNDAGSDTKQCHNPFPIAKPTPEQRFSTRRRGEAASLASQRWPWAVGVVGNAMS
uniref:Uncharacterized protein n=1 Tax=Vitis vinifera TaxID=29760 RepID=A5C6G7_VITVI|nr:hypothetical protein VITISV_038645 [Vitis vinifera]